MTVTEFDIIVMGAGPAGVAASVVLKEAGHSVLLIDRVVPDKLKVGESVPGAAVRLLKRLGIAGIDQLLKGNEYLNSTANASAWGSEQWSYQNALMNPDGGGWHVLRHCFDEHLRQHAIDQGVMYLEGIVDRFEFDDGMYELQLKGSSQRVKAHWLIDATGRKGLVVRKLGAVRQKFSEQYAAIAWTRASANDQDQMTRVKSVPEGWWYTSKLPGGLRVSAFQCLPELAAAMVRNERTFFKTWQDSNLLDLPLEPRDLVQPLVARDASVQISSQVYGDQWLAIGDAAMSFDPLSSQGIFFALYSGMRGAEAVADCLRNPLESAQCLRQYQGRVKEVFQANMRSRNQFYGSELRYREHDYWKRQLSFMAGKG